MSGVRRSAHMGPMTATLDHVLAAAGTSRDELDIIVSQNRGLTENMELVLASHFPVEDLAAGIEQLGSRLAVLVDLAQAHLEDEGPAGDLARAIAAVAAADVRNGKELVRAHLGLPSDDAAQRPILGDFAVYGHPDLRLVSHSVLDHGKRAFVHARCLVHLSTGEITELPEDVAVHDRLGAARI